MVLRLAAACLFVFVGSVSPAVAQFSKTMHSSFPVEGAEAIHINLVDNVTVESWAGNTILVQTDVRLFNASKGLFDFLTGEDGRYLVSAGTDGTTLNLVNVKPSRAELVSKQGTCREEINVKVLLPADFVGEGSGPFHRVSADTAVPLVATPVEVGVGVAVDSTQAPIEH